MRDIFTEHEQRIAGLIRGHLERPIVLEAHLQCNVKWKLPSGWRGPLRGPLTGFGAAQAARRAQAGARSWPGSRATLTLGQICQQIGNRQQDALDVPISHGIPEAWDGAREVLRQIDATWAPYKDLHAAPFSSVRAFIPRELEEDYPLEWRQIAARECMHRLYMLLLKDTQPGRLLWRLRPEVWVSTEGYQGGTWVTISFAARHERGKPIADETLGDNWFAQELHRWNNRQKRPKSMVQAYDEARRRAGSIAADDGIPF